MMDTALWGGLLILILCRQSQSFCETVNKDPCIEETKKTWSEASESCNLVVSNTPLRVGVPITDIPVLKYISSAPTYKSENLHWIGATGTFTQWFELAGCNLYLNFSFNKQWMPSSKLGPVAQCQQICENWRNSYKEIGINETHCFCAGYKDTSFIKKLTCDQQNSKNFKNDLIGTGIDQRSGRGNYVFASYRKVILTTEIDDTLDQCLLETNEGYKTNPCDAADITQRTWVERYRNETNNSSLPRRSPYVRRLIISWKKGTTTPRTTSSSHGTLRRQTTFRHQITDSSPDERQNDNNVSPDSILSLIIGSAVGGILCFVIVVIITVIFIKRRRPNRKEKYHTAPTEKVHYSEMKEDRKPHLAMEKEEPSPTVHNTDYDTMMSVNKKKITEDSGEYGKLLSNGEADVYNHTWDKPITEQLTDHVYSSIMSGK